MHITFRQLRVFESVARHLSYTKAAEELHLTQPAVSMQVRQLEDAIGLPLFEKLGKKIHLTEAGREMFQYSQNISNQLREASEVFESLKGVTRGHLRISVATTANHFATRVLAAFTRAFPGTSFSLDVTNRKTLLRQLTENETDLVIMGRPPRDLEVTADVFMDNPLVVIVPPDHPLLEEFSACCVPMSRIQNETFVVRERESGTRIAMERFFNEHGFHLQAGMEMTSNEAIKHAVEAGMGLGIVSIHTIELELETGRLEVLEVEKFPIMRHWYMVQGKGKRLPPVALAFKEFLHSEEAAHLLKSPVRHPIAEAVKIL